MQYTATSYAEPLVRIFDDAWSPPETSTSPRPRSPAIWCARWLTANAWSTVERGIYEPAIRLISRLGDVARRAQNGSVHRYLGFSFTALVIVLLVVTW